ncbi:prepilin peptidase [Leuconostoc falkenbergense]|nr:prepilin peptidase [Leuconostoc falkenbergense]
MENILILIFNSIIVSSVMCANDRIQHNISLLQPRSFCLMCHHLLKWYDLVPFFSAIFTFAKCRYCHKHFGWRYPALELTCTLFGTILWYSSAFQWLIAVVLLFLSLEDCASQAIHSYLIIPLLLYAIHQHHDQSHIFLALLISLISYYLVYIRHALGSGDIPVLLTLIFSTTTLVFVLGLLLGCCLATLFLALSSQKRLPFVPFLTIGWLLIGVLI